MLLNPENQLLQSFQNPQQSPLGSLRRSRECAHVHQLPADKEWWALSSVSGCPNHKDPLLILYTSQPQGPLDTGARHSAFSSLLHAMGNPQ